MFVLGPCFFMHVVLVGSFRVFSNHLAKKESLV